MATTYGDILAEKSMRWSETAARREYVESKMTSMGGYTKVFLKSIGVSWPPPPGWKEHYIKCGKLPEWYRHGNSAPQRKD